MKSDQVSGPPGPTVLSTRSDYQAGHKGRPTARLSTRPGIAVAASAPVALVVLAILPSYRPHALIACLLGWTSVSNL